MGDSNTLCLYNKNEAPPRSAIPGLIWEFHMASLTLARSYPFHLPDCNVLDLGSREGTVNGILWYGLKKGGSKTCLNLFFLTLQQKERGTCI